MMANYIYDPDTDELVPTNSVKGKLLVEQARSKANAVVQSAGSEMSGGGVSSKPMGVPEVNRPNIVENRIPEPPTDGSDSSDGNKTKKLVSTVDNKDGTFTNTYDDGTTDITGTKTTGTGRKLVSTVDNKDGTFTNTYDDGTTDITGTKTTGTGRKLVSTVDNKDGTFTNTYDDGTTDITGTKTTGTGRKLVSTVDNKDGTFTNTYDDGTTDITGTKTTGNGSPTIYTATDGTKFTDQSSYVNYQNSLNTAKTAATTAFNERVSAYSLLKSEFEKYGLGSLVGDIRSLAEKNLSPSEFSIELRNTKAYQDRFAGNAARIKAGYGAISEAAYIELENSYQSTMRRYGLPESYWAKDAIGTQAEFQKFIAGDVSPIELEDRIQLAVNRVNNASPEIMQSLTQFYPGITKGNLLAYVLDPQKALPLIQRQIQAAEIGGAALQSGLSSNVTRAEQLAAAGITQQQAQQGYGAIGGWLQRGSELASVYGESPYTQTTAESEIFNLPGQQEAAKQRKKLTGLEEATFGGTTGMSSSAASRERAGQY